MNKLKIGMVSLGCDKNRIDSEIMLGELKNKYEITNDPKLADIIIVNTCGFIESAKQESINTILEMAQYKTKYNCKVLAATGCLTQRYGNKLLELIPEIDILLGVNDYDKLIKSIDDFLNSKNKVYFCSANNKNINVGNRVLSTGNYSTYLRISEGCNNFCAYCIIPKIRGRYRSRKMEDIIDEAKCLASQGVKEIILIGQDTTAYGIDLYGERKLDELIQSISLIDGIKWIRVLYTYAEEITDKLIETLRTNPKVCKYLDMPIQHISDDILIKMNRKGRKKDIINVINKLKDRVEDICLRTTLIVGFPRETEENFNELKNFVMDTKFDNLGVFKYSREEGTTAASMKDQIDESIKQQRLDEIMKIQKNISRKLNEQKIGKLYDVIVEKFDGNMYSGRNFEMAPEIDGAIFFECDKILSVGEIVKVRITKALEYDLIGVVCYESCE